VANYPKISIITPSYNQGQYIEQTILSVLNQNYPNLEYIVIDGGSTDNTADILKKYDDRISYWVSEPDKGQTDAINKGFQKATGEIINWLNSDDYYQDGCLFQIAESFKNQETLAVTTIVRNFEENGDEWNEQTSHLQSSADFAAKAFNNQPGTFFRKSLWDRYFPVPTGLRYIMDQYLWLCYWMENDQRSFQVESYTTTFFRRHANSKTSVSLNAETFHYLGIDFFNEHNLLFWSLFANQDLAKANVVATYFVKGFDFTSRKIAFPVYFKTDRDKEKVFHLYLFELLKEDFQRGNFERLKINFPSLDRSFLTQEDQVWIEKIQRAIRFPKLIRAYRRMYWAKQKLIRR